MNGLVRGNMELPKMMMTKISNISAICSKDYSYYQHKKHQNSPLLILFLLESIGHQYIQLKGQ